uniref:Interleukin-12 subunit alpha n=1 Tax=Felis catus TaxID=9685 RepID=A0ABI7WWI4_FELCA
MCPPRGLLLVTILVLLNHLDHLSLARNLPTPTPSPGMFQCLNHSQTLLRAISNTLQKARQTLEFYSCTSEEIDHEDITKDKTSTVEACLPLELTMNESCLASREISLITNGSCLASRKTSFMTTLCLSSIYEDLKMYQVEFKAMNAKLLMDPKRQIFLDQNMLTAIDELLQVLQGKCFLPSSHPLQLSRFLPNPYASNQNPADSGNTLYLPYNRLEEVG